MKHIHTHDTHTHTHTHLALVSSPHLRVCMTDPIEYSVHVVSVDVYILHTHTHTHTHTRAQNVSQCSARVSTTHGRTRTQVAHLEDVCASSHVWLHTMGIEAVSSACLWGVPHVMCMCMCVCVCACFAHIPIENVVCAYIEQIGLVRVLCKHLCM